ncbi:MAG: hypothetical protein LVR00_05205 [Rhabdochlamydiaceae bacterium]|jgi:hypothetical protein
MYFVRVVFILCVFLTTSLPGGLVTEHESVYFSPEDNVEKRLIELIEEEKRASILRSIALRIVRLVTH